MRKERIITILGLLVIFVPMLGILSSYKVIIFAALGLAIVILSIDRAPKEVGTKQEEVKRPEVGSEVGSDNIQA